MEKFGRTLRLKRNYKNGEQTFDPNLFQPESKFNPRKADAAIEQYLSHIEKKLLPCNEIKHSYYNLTREKRKTIGLLS